ncbi:MAG: hypothetical protein IKO95_08465 [Spirochaetia bacterium]|nr:hypothetical protein [Spirochaetia bacterium]
MREIFFNKEAITALLSEIAAAYDEKGGSPLTVQPIHQRSYTAWPS